MNDLGPEARSVLEAARGAEVLSRADRNRIKHGVLMRVAAAGAVSAVAGGAAAMSAATKITLIAVTTVVLGGGSALVWKGRAPAPTEAPRTHQVVPSRPAAVVPTRVEEPAPRSLPEVRRRNLPLPRRAPAVIARTPEASSTEAPVVSPPVRTAPGSLDPELAMLRQAQDDLRAGLPAQALRRLASYDRQFPKGALNEERRAIEAIALCQAYPGPAAQAKAERFLRHAPLSPLAERVRATCKKNRRPWRIG